jgi:hypothetical protein
METLILDDGLQVTRWEHIPKAVGGRLTATRW